jgi:hypothetical protein
MPDNGLPQRSMKTTAALVTFFTIVFVTRGDLATAAGLALGGALGLFSLWSLAFGIPRLVHHENPASKFLLALLTLAKLPVYGVSLYYAMASPFISPLATFAGVAAVPVVITLKVLGYQLVQGTDGPAGDETCRTNPVLSK